MALGDIKLTNYVLSDQMHVKATALESSEVEYDYVPAIEQGVIMSASIGLPSIVHADAELMLEYMNNLTSCCVVQYNVSSNSATFVMSVDNRGTVHTSI